MNNMKEYEDMIIDQDITKPYTDKFNDCFTLITDFLIGLSQVFFTYEIVFVKTLLKAENRNDYLEKKQKVKIERNIMLGLKTVIGLAILTSNSLVIFDVYSSDNNEEGLMRIYLACAFVRLADFLCDLYVYSIFFNALCFFIMKKKRQRKVLGGILSNFSNTVVIWLIYSTVAFGIVNLTA